MAEVDFNVILSIVAFLVLTWITGRLARLVKISPIIGELTCGMVFGPHSPLCLLGDGTQVPSFIIGWLSLCGRTHQHFLSLCGYVGVTLLIFESGMHIKDRLCVVGGLALLVAVLVMH